VDIIEERHRYLGLKKGCAMSLNALAPWYDVLLAGRIPCLRNTCRFVLVHSVRVAHFLPLFLMPWLPVFRGPLPPAFLASSSRAFLSVAKPLEYAMVFPTSPRMSYLLPTWPCVPCHPHPPRRPSSWASCCELGWCPLVKCQCRAHNVGQQE
jgi:hypothetical protein